MSAQSKNVLLVWDRMGDYHRARWHALQSKFKDRTVYTADFGAKDNLYNWETTEKEQNYFQLSTKRPDQTDFQRIIRFVKILSSHHIDTVCIAGYGRPAYLLFLIYGKLTGRRVILFAESWYPSSRVIDYIKAAFLKYSCCGFLVSGERAFNHFTQRLNIPTSRVKIGYSVVDNNHFSLPDFPLEQKKKTLLCIARFSPEKNLILLVEAFKKSLMEKDGWGLRIVGGGPLKEELQNRNNSHIELKVWQAYEYLPRIYNEASVFILPSTFEPWGLVVNEAMAASLPIIVSTEVGCLPDLLKTGVNGWSFAPDDEENLISVLNAICSVDMKELNKMGEKSREIIEDFTTSFFSENLKVLIETT